MAKTVAEKQTESKPVIAVNETEIKAQLGQLVRQSVEETLNGLLEAEADRLCKAGRYQRNAERVDTRAGHYQRHLQTQAGEVKLQVPKLRSLPFETPIIERYRRRESSVEEALLEMYYAGVSMRRVEDITDALWGTRVSPSTISDLNQKLAGRIEDWRTRRLTGAYVYVWLDAIWLKRSWGGEVQNVSVLVAIGVNADGLREVVGVQAGEREDHDSWYNFLKALKERGLAGTELFITDKCLGLVAAVAEVFPAAQWQRCVVHWYRNVMVEVSRSKLKDVVPMLKAIHAQEDREAAQQKAQEVVKKLLAMKLANGGANRPGWRGRDLGLYELPAGALVEDPDDQSAGADHAGNPAPDARGRSLPRRQRRRAAGRGPPAPHCRDALGYETIYESEAAPSQGG